MTKIKDSLRTLGPPEHPNILSKEHTDRKTDLSKVMRLMDPQKAAVI